MKVPSLSSPLPWIVHRGNWKDFRQAFSPLWSYSHGDWADVSVRDLLTGHWTHLRCEGSEGSKGSKGSEGGGGG